MDILRVFYVDLGFLPWVTVPFVDLEHQELA